MSKTIVCLDYDGTYTALPAMCEMIIEFGKKHSDDVQVILATMRHAEEADADLKELAKRIDVHYTGREAKQQYLAKRGIIPTMWLDDNPQWIFTNSR